MMLCLDKTILKSDNFSSLTKLVLCPEISFWSATGCRVGIFADFVLCSSMSMSSEMKKTTRKFKIKCKIEIKRKFKSKVERKTKLKVKLNIKLNLKAFMQLKN